jgi:NADH-quinone oxidoreductase subunit E
MKKSTTKAVKNQHGSHKPDVENDVLVRGLKLLSEYYSLNLNEVPLNKELKNIENEAISSAVNQSNKKEAIEQITKLLSQADNIIHKYQNDKSALIQILLDIQEQSHWLPKPTLLWISEKLGVPLTQIYHIGTFYKAFSLVPRGRHLVQVCLGTACQVRGGPRILDRVRDVLKINPGETDQDQKFSLMTVNCLGCCALGPVLAIDEDYYSNPSVKQLKQIVADYK